MPTISLTNDTASGKVKTDALVVGITSGKDGPALAPGSTEVDKALGGRLLEALKAVGAAGKIDEVTKIATNGSAKAPVVVAVGLGDAPSNGSFDAERLRVAAGAAVRALAGTDSVALALPATTSEEAVAVAEGSLFGAYEFTRYRFNGSAKSPVKSLTVHTSTAREATTKDGVSRAEALAEAVAFCRDLINTPAADLHPADFADAAVGRLKGVSGVRAEVLDEKALANGGYGGILGVGQGAADPPRLLKITYTPRGLRKAPHLALVGKGITFDSGGLSIKTGEGMVAMKCDMSGAAAVVAATLAAARTGVKTKITAYACLAENMPSGTAIRPSDVLTMYGGKTVEVLNTDAEGRLVLADGIVKASEEKPDLIVDVATLTGACMIALGDRTSGVMSTDESARDLVIGASKRAGEQMWALPLPREMRSRLDSSVADLANVGGKYGGALIAGLFLADFVPEGQRWVHVDIAGPAFTDKPFGYTPKGGTGAAVRTLVALAEDLATA